MLIHPSLEGLGTVHYLFGRPIHALLKGRLVFGEAETSELDCPASVMQYYAVAHSEDGIGLLRTMVIGYFELKRSVFRLESNHISPL